MHFVSPSAPPLSYTTAVEVPESGADFPLIIAQVCRGLLSRPGDNCNFTGALAVLPAFCPEPHMFYDWTTAQTGGKPRGGRMNLPTGDMRPTLRSHYLQPPSNCTIQMLLKNGGKVSPLAAHAAPAFVDLPEPEAPCLVIWTSPTPSLTWHWAQAKPITTTLI